MRKASILLFVFILSFANGFSAESCTYKQKNHSEIKKQEKKPEKKINLSKKKYFFKKIFDDEPEKEKLGFYGFLTSVLSPAVAILSAVIIWGLLIESNAALTVFAIMSFILLAAGIFSVVSGIISLIRHKKYKHKYNKKHQAIISIILGIIETLIFSVMSYFALAAIALQGYSF